MVSYTIDFMGSRLVSAFGKLFSIFLLVSVLMIDVAVR